MNLMRWLNLKIVGNYDLDLEEAHEEIGRPMERLAELDEERGKWACANRLLIARIKELEN